MPVAVNDVKSFIAVDPTSWESYSKDHHKQYRSIMGTLSHVANFTHPEIAFSNSFASQFMANPTEAHLVMVLGILLYLCTVKGKQLDSIAVTAPPPVPIPFASPATRILEVRHPDAATGFCAYLYGMLMPWHSRLQPLVSLSTAVRGYRCSWPVCWLL